MKVRQDAMTAVAEAVLWIERKCGGGAYPDIHNPPTAGINAEAEAVEDHADDSLVCTTGSVSSVARGQQCHCWGGQLQCRRQVRLCCAAHLICTGLWLSVYGSAHTMQGACL